MIIIMVVIIRMYTSYVRKKVNKSRLTEFVAELEHRDKSERLLKSGKYHTDYYVMLVMIFSYAKKFLRYFDRRLNEDDSSTFSSSNKKAEDF